MPGLLAPPGLSHSTGLAATTANTANTHFCHIHLMDSGTANLATRADSLAASYGNRLSREARATGDRILK